MRSLTKSHPLGGHGMFDLTGFPEVVAMEERYLPAEELQKYQAPSIGAYDPRTGRNGEISSQD
jgi:hypothetical protein